MIAITSSGASLDRCPGLLPPFLNVDAHHEEPQHYRFLPEETAGQIVGGNVLCERWHQIGHPTQTGKRHQDAQNSGQKDRTENEVADQEARESAKYHSDVHAPRIPSKSPEAESHEIEGRREQREAPVHRLKDV